MFSGGKKLTGELPKKLDNDLDKWIVAKLIILHQEVTVAMNEYNLVKATRPLVEFVDDLSTWYVRRSRDRFKNGDKQALDTLALVLRELSKIIAPFAPLTAEAIYQEFKNKETSVHLSEWSKLDDKLINEQVLEQMEAVRQAVEKVHALRAKSGIKVRQPLAATQIVTKEITLNLGYELVLKDELNVEEIKQVKEIKTADGWVADEEKTVALDTNLTDELKNKGTVRELIRFINTLRKEAGLKPSDSPIETYQTKSDYLKKVIAEYKDELIKSTSAGDLIDSEEKVKVSKDCQVNGEDITLGLKL